MRVDRGQSYSIQLFCLWIALFRPEHNSSSHSHNDLVPRCECVLDNNQRPNLIITRIIICMNERGPEWSKHEQNKVTKCPDTGYHRARLPPTWSWSNTTRHDPEPIHYSGPSSWSSSPLAVFVCVFDLLGPRFVSMIQQQQQMINMHISRPGTSANEHIIGLALARRWLCIRTDPHTQPDHTVPIQLDSTDLSASDEID